MYQMFMLGVDKGDQMRAHGGGFSQKAHFKKWYKKLYLAMLDAMLLNTLVVWNDRSQDIRLDHPIMKRHEFYQHCTQRMMSMSDPNKQNVSPAKLQAVGIHAGTIAHVALATKQGTPCVVCHLETGAGLGGDAISMSGLCTHVVNCLHCNISAHSCIPNIK
jgi:hypothetical protein